MIQYLERIPNECTVAFSGGVDSVAVADFLVKGRKKVTLAYFDHGTEHSKNALTFVQKFAEVRALTLITSKITREKLPDESPEEFWRNERYRFLHSLSGEVITAHHLDDAVETWLFNCLNGNPRVLPVRNRNVVRPFLITPKEELLSWCARKNLSWIEDESNIDLRYTRNQIRHRVIPESLKVNPGLKTVVKKMYLRDRTK